MPRERDIAGIAADMDIGHYEREGRATYAGFAATVASILRAAIRTDSRLRLQQVTDRAKACDSLMAKLAQRGISDTTTLELDIKDLAGCRVIFYTNADVRRFLGSGLIGDNFEVLEVKLHQPRRQAEDATELYISNHYLVTLRPERLALPEYERFAGLRCEVQVQTILNHAWAEMAHDTIYKTPDLDGFGAAAMAGVKKRLAKVAQRYLVPAGYEFQRIALDFERLMAGKALFEQGALDAILNAEDNNIRVDAIETFAESVLPYYDDAQTEYPTIAARLVEAVAAARTTLTVPVETPYGEIPAKTVADVVRGVTDILDRYRYLDVDATFEAVCDLYVAAARDEERKPILNVATDLAKHERAVWRTQGPVVQWLLVDRIAGLTPSEAQALRPLLTAMLGEILKSEVTGTTNSSNAITLHQGGVIASENLRTIRDKAITLLKAQVQAAETDGERRVIFHALDEATRTPYSVNYSNAVAQMVFEDSATILEFKAEIAPSLGFELLQSLEDRAHNTYENYTALPPNMADDAGLVEAAARLRAAALAFRAAANRDPDFAIYKILVGFNSVFPPAWDDKTFGYEQAEAYRTARLPELLAEVTPATADRWLALLTRCAQTQSEDLATFPTFGRFLTELGATKPEIVRTFIDRMGPDLGRFLPAMLDGLLKGSGAGSARDLVVSWIDDGRHLRDIAWQLGFGTPLDADLLRRTLAAAVAREDGVAIRNCLIAATRQFKAAPNDLIDTVFLPALRRLVLKDDWSWVRTVTLSWMNHPLLLALDADQAREVLDALVPYPDLQYAAEHIVGAIARRWPNEVIAYLGRRQAGQDAEDTPGDFQALPYNVYDLKEPLAGAGEALVTAARGWFDASQMMFQVRGGRLLATVFPGLPAPLPAWLEPYAAVGDSDDLAFVLAVLANFEGNVATHPLLKLVIARLAPDDRLLGMVRVVLFTSGMVRGDYGMADRYARQKAELEAWRTDPRETVRTFAEAFIRELETAIADAERSAEAEIALRKLTYDEELDDPPPS